MLMKATNEREIIYYAPDPGRVEKVGLLMNPPFLTNGLIELSSIINWQTISNRIACNRSRGISFGQPQ
jgi:hypothetical protein